MPEFNVIILYVSNPEASTAFYTDIIGHPAVETSPNFAMLPLSDGVMLGLWRKEAVEPLVQAVPGSSEIAFTVASEAAVDATHSDWLARGLAILQPPTRMDFGRTFVAIDPDGHRLRVFAPGEA